MALFAPPPAFSPADSARAVATVYTASLLALVPVAVAGGIALALRRANAQGRTLAWRSAVVVLLLIIAGRQLPLHWMAWVVPSTLAAPLVALGRVQVMSVNAALDAGETPSGGGTSAAAMILFVYAVGVVAVCVSTVVGLWRARRILGRARPADADWLRAMDDARAMLGLRRRIRVLISRDVSVPLTWGYWRPVVLLPASLPRWSADERRLVMLHEAEHARSGDWLFALAARAACAVYWFHPAVWWTANQLRADCELACDERVVAAGARRSDYADLLVRAVDALAMQTGDELPALALSRRGGLRTRLSALVDAPREIRPLARRWAAAATGATLIASAPLSAVELAPTRDVLTTLMSDTRWESRAYAVLGLAQRPDSIAVARSAAALDPSPRVREWARYALDRQTVPAGLSASFTNP